MIALQTLGVSPVAWQTNAFKSALAEPGSDQVEGSDEFTMTFECYDDAQTAAAEPRVPQSEQFQTPSEPIKIAEL